MKVNILNRIVVAAVISAVSLVGMSIPTTAQQQPQRDQNHQKKQQPHPQRAQQQQPQPQRAQQQQQAQQGQQRARLSQQRQQQPLSGAVGK